MQIDCVKDFSRFIKRKIFRKSIDKALNYTPNNIKGGDSILMFKILVLQKLYNISDEQTEYQILDRISFLNFLGLSSQVPDARTIWKFRETLTKAGIIKDLFNLFNKQIADKNLITKQGSIVDASFVEVPLIEFCL